MSTDPTEFHYWALRPRETVISENVIQLNPSHRKLIEALANAYGTATPLFPTNASERREWIRQVRAVLEKAGNESGLTIEQVENALADDLFNSALDNYRLCLALGRPDRFVLRISKWESEREFIARVVKDVREKASEHYRSLERKNIVRNPGVLWMHLRHHGMSCKEIARRYTATSAEAVRRLTERASKRLNFPIDARARRRGPKTNPQ